MSSKHHIDPSLPQKQAADPAASVWVSASAGTGKTKVLTDRVLSLLLSGVSPMRILCLTYTNAAAAEMANRLMGRLQKWALLSDEALLAEMAALPINTSDKEVVLGRARRLFASVLEVPDGLKIKTIHGFCQSVLKRFPLEAEIAPHFEVMDERDAEEALRQAQEIIFDKAADPASPLHHAVAQVTARLHERTFAQLLQLIKNNRASYRRMLSEQGGCVGATMALQSALGLDPTLSEEDYCRAAMQDSAFNIVGLRRCLSLLEGSNKTDKERAQKMATFFSLLPEERGDMLDVYQSAYLTDKGQIRASLLAKKLSEKHPDIAECLQEEAQRIVEVNNIRKAYRLAKSSAALLVIAEAMLDVYARYKAQRALLDYDDLILKTRALLEESQDAAWVLYKLDGGIDHLLVDEAQDSSPDQWAVIRKLTDDFFGGISARDETRTVFAVGDRKQSIYSFQGADPQAFDDTKAALPVKEVDLSVSFRSVPAVLEAVDNVFADPAMARGVIADGEAAKHISYREGQAGLVELWPAVQPTPVDKEAAWMPPTEMKVAQSAQARLAGMIAEKIAGMIAEKEVLSSYDRPIRAGDFLILVRRRTAFVGALVRALKEKNIPVAGVDRMALGKELAVQDLLALAEFLLLPEDDLSLACVLKSPLLGLSEDDLFTLAYDRGGKSLWAALKEKAGDSSAFEAAHSFLAAAMNKLDYLRPHDFFSYLLDGTGGRRKILARLGLQAEDPLDEFLSLTLLYEQSHPPDMQGFLHWFAEGTSEIKRDMDQTEDAVRIMTSHGAKGLQAPIVFLPDTLGVPKMPSPLLLNLGTEDMPLMLWVSGGKEACNPRAESAYEAYKERQLEETRRLLYVAMTRAEDRLYLCGWSGRTKPSGDSWYKMMEKALLPIMTTAEDVFFEENTGKDTFFRLQSAQAAIPDKATPIKGAAQPLESVAIPAWAERPLQMETGDSFLAPSQKTVDAAGALSPRSAKGPDSFGRGRAIHRLLELLAGMAPEKRKNIGAQSLKNLPDIFSDVEKEAMLTEVLSVLSDPEFAPLFDEGSAAEVPVVGQIGAQHYTGIIDRLCVTEAGVMIVDYKTDRPPPDDVADVAPFYLSQLAIYQALVRQIWPDKPVSCALLWTSRPLLMPVPEALLSVEIADAS